MQPLRPIPDRLASVHRVAQHADPFGIGIKRRVRPSAASRTGDTLLIERLRDLAWAVPQYVAFEDVSYPLCLGLVNVTLVADVRNNGAPISIRQRTR